MLEILGTCAHIGNKIISGITILLMLLLFVYGTYSLWDLYRIYHQTTLSDELKALKPTGGASSRQSFEELWKINPDVVAWITIDDTHIDYPMVQGKDDMEYVNKDLYGNFSMSGAIFLSAENKRDFSDPYNLTFGHYLNNGGMYGDIEKFLDESYFNDHLTGTLYLPDKTYRIELYAVVSCDAYNSQIYNVPRICETMDEFQEYVRSVAQPYRDIEISDSDKIIALSTCGYSVTNGRNIALGRLVEDDNA